MCVCIRVCLYMYARTHLDTHTHTQSSKHITAVNANVSHPTQQMQKLDVCAVFSKMFESVVQLLSMSLSVSTLTLKPRGQTDKVSPVAGGCCVL